MSKGGFQASLDLECDQLNMKKCLIKLIRKSLKGSQKLKATMPVPHGIWQSSHSPLATNAGLSLQRDVQPFHFSGCHHGSRDHPGSHHPHHHPPIMNRSTSNLSQGTWFHLRKANREKPPFFSTFRAWQLRRRWHHAGAGHGSRGV